MHTKAVRSAKLNLSRGPTGPTLTGSVPRDITEKDFAVLGRSILDVIRNHTGCNCLSGVIQVVLEEEFAETLNVELVR